MDSQFIVQTGQKTINFLFYYHHCFSQGGQSAPPAPTASWWPTRTTAAPWANGAAISATRSYECSREIQPGQRATAAIGDLWARDLSPGNTTRTTGDLSAKDPQRCTQQKNHRRHSEELTAISQLRQWPLPIVILVIKEHIHSFIFTRGSTSILCGEQLLRPFFQFKVATAWNHG